MTDEPAGRGSPGADAQSEPEPFSAPEAEPRSHPELVSNPEQVPRPRKGPPPEKRPFDLGLLLIERKSDVIAFVALILSSTSFLVALHWLFKGPEPALLPPETITVAAYLEPDSDQRVLALRGLMRYVNRGEVDQPWIGVEERVRFRLPQSKAAHTFLGSGFFNYLRVHSTLIEISEKSKAPTPFQVPGGGVLAHNTEFLPRRASADGGNVDRDFLSPYDFVTPLVEQWRASLNGADANDASLKIPATLELDFCAYDLDGEAVGTRCRAELFYSDLFDLAENKDRKLRVDTDLDTDAGVGWTTVQCIPMKPQPSDACQR